MKQLWNLTVITILTIVAQTTLAATPIQSCVSQITQTLGLNGQNGAVLVGTSTKGDQTLTCNLTLTTTEERNSVYLKIETHDEANGNKLVSGANILLFDPAFDESLVKMNLNSCDVGQNISVQYQETQQQGYRHTNNNRFSIERNAEGRITKVTAFSEGVFSSGDATVCTFN